MSNVSSPDFVGDTQTRSAGSLWAEGLLFLDDNNDSVTCKTEEDQSNIAVCMSFCIPILACCLFFRMTATHSTTAAPELSMQLSIVWH
jgi:hypothetical protein